jgi:hypothetical protein
MSTIHPIVASLISVNVEVKSLRDMEEWLNGLALLGTTRVEWLFTQYVEIRVSRWVEQGRSPAAQKAVEVLVKEVERLPMPEAKKVPSYWSLLQQWRQATTVIEVRKPQTGIPPMKGFKYYS